MVERLANTEVNQARLLHVEKMFGRTGMPLDRVGRVLIGEGMLLKMTRKKLKQRYFFLFTDMLIYGKVITPQKTYTKQRVIPLEEMEIDDVDVSEDGKAGFLIKTRRRSFSVFAASITEKNQWLKYINRCLTGLENRGKRSITPVWVPDDNADECMACRQTKFNLINRRHHCRGCGYVIGKCCGSKKYRLDTVKKKKVRVCDQCYEEYSRLDEEAKKFLTPPPELLSDNSNSDSDSDSDEEGENQLKEHCWPRFYLEEMSSPYM